MVRGFAAANRVHRTISTGNKMRDADGAPLYPFHLYGATVFFSFLFLFFIFLFFCQIDIQANRTERERERHERGEKNV